MKMLPLRVARCRNSIFPSMEMLRWEASQAEFLSVQKCNQEEKVTIQERNLCPSSHLYNCIKLNGSHFPLMLALGFNVWVWTSQSSCLVNVVFLFHLISIWFHRNIHTFITATENSSVGLQHAPIYMHLSVHKHTYWKSHQKYSIYGSYTNCICSGAWMNSWLESWFFGVYVIFCKAGFIINWIVHSFRHMFCLI